MTLGTFGLLVWVACLCAFYVLQEDFRRRKVEADALNIVLITTFAGIAGAKLWHVLESPQELLAAPLSVLFDRAGFAWFGGLAAGITALVVLGKRASLSSLEMLDACAPAAAVGYGVGRLGCLISGDGDYGIPTSLPWGMSFPNGIVPTTQRVHPTPIYELIAGLLIGWFLWKQGSKALRGSRPAGQITGQYLILTGLARFFVEFIRINPRVLWGMSNAQVASLGSIAAGILLLILSKRRFRRSKEEPRILERQRQRGDAMQSKYHRATLECFESRC